MARRATPRENSPSHPISDKDDAEIGDALGATPIDPENPENGMRVDEDKILAAGAVDTETIRRNNMNRDAVDKKRDGQKSVTLNEPDLLVKYDLVAKLWPVNTLMISVKRTTGTPAQWTISPTKDGRELYNAIRQLHGRREETSYHVTLHDNNRRETRGAGMIHMPDTRDDPSLPQGQPPPMNPYYPQPPYPPPMYGQPPPQAVTAVPVVAQPIPPQSPPGGMDMAAMMAVLKQQFELLQSVQKSAQPAPAPPPAAPPQDFAALLAAMQQAMQPAPQPAPAPPPPQQPGMLGMPPVQPPPGMMFVPGFGFVPVQKLMEALGATQQPAPQPPPMRGPTMGGYPYMPPPPPAPPRTAADQFRDAVTLVQSAVNAAQQMQSILPTQQQQPQQQVYAPADEEDESPVRVLDVGGNKIVLNKEDGSTRFWETGFANADKILKWLGEQREAIETRAQQQQQHRAPPQQLPPGYVEVGPGYQPPPGYVAVPVPTSSGLPEPPANMPPPIGAPPAPPEAQTAWDQGT